MRHNLPQCECYLKSKCFFRFSRQAEAGSNFSFVQTPVDWTVTEPNICFEPYFIDNCKDWKDTHTIGKLVEVLITLLSEFLQRLVLQFKLICLHFKTKLQTFYLHRGNFLDIWAESRPMLLKGILPKIALSNNYTQIINRL